MLLSGYIERIAEILSTLPGVNFDFCAFHISENLNTSLNNLQNHIFNCNKTLEVIVKI